MVGCVIRAGSGDLGGVTAVDKGRGCRHRFAALGGRGDRDITADGGVYTRSAGGQV